MVDHLAGLSAPDYYHLLGIEEDAPLETVNQAYREKVREWHPDVSEAENAEQRFKAAVQAREVLTNLDERARYNELGHHRYVKDDSQPRLPSAQNESSEAQTRTSSTGAAERNGATTVSSSGTGQTQGGERTSRRTTRSTETYAGAGAQTDESGIGSDHPTVTGGTDNASGSRDIYSFGSATEHISAGPTIEAVQEKVWRNRAVGAALGGLLGAIAIIADGGSSLSPRSISQFPAIVAGGVLIVVLTALLVRADSQPGTITSEDGDRPAVPLRKSIILLSGGVGLIALSAVSGHTSPWQLPYAVLSGQEVTGPWADGGSALTMVINFVLEGVFLTCAVSGIILLWSSISKQAWYDRYAMGKPIHPEIWDALLLVATLSVVWGVLGQPGAPELQTSRLELIFGMSGGPTATSLGTIGLLGSIILGIAYSGRSQTAGGLDLSETDSDNSTADNTASGSD